MARSRTSGSNFANAFGEALDRQLAKRSLRQKDLAAATGSSSAYISRLMNGAKVSPTWANLIATSLNSTAQERLELHATAAQTWGYDLVLTPGSGQNDVKTEVNAPRGTSEKPGGQ